MAAAGGDVIGLDWRDPARRRLGAVGPTAPCRGTSTRPSLLAPWERVEARGRSTCSRAPAAARATSSTSATACCPQTDPDVLDAARRARPRAHERRSPHERPAVVLMAYGSPDRLEDVPAYYADIRGGRPIRPELLDDLVERYRRLGIERRRTPLNAITEETRAALEAELGLPVFTGMKHWDAADRRRGRGRARRRARDRSSGSCSRRTTRALDRAATGSSSTRRVAGRAELASSRAGTTSRASSRSSPTASRAARRPAPRRLHRALAPGADPRGGRPVPGRSCWRRARLVAERRRRRRLVASRTSRESPTGEPWLGPDILDHLADAARRRASTTSSSARSASSPTTSRSAGTSTSRPASARTSSACASTGSRCRTPTRRSSACSPASSGARCGGTARAA